MVPGLRPGCGYLFYHWPCRGLRHVTPPHTHQPPGLELPSGLERVSSSDPFFIPRPRLLPLTVPLPSSLSCVPETPQSLPTLPATSRALESS